MPDRTALFSISPAERSTAANLYVGVNANLASTNARWNLHGGTASVGNLFAGYYSGNSGTIDMSDGTLTTGAFLSVGRQGTGTFNQSGGLVNASATSVRIGDYGSGPDPTGVGTYLLSNGTLIANDLHPGWFGNGTFVQSGGFVTTAAGLTANGMTIGEATQSLGAYYLMPARSRLTPTCRSAASATVCWSRAAARLPI